MCDVSQRRLARFLVRQPSRNLADSSDRRRAVRRHRENRRDPRAPFGGRHHLCPKSAFYICSPQPSERRGSAQLYVFNLLTPFRYDWRDILGRLRAAQPDAAIVVAIDRPTRDAIDDAMRAGADELLYEPELSFPQLIWQRIGGFLEPPNPHPPSPVPRPPTPHRHPGPSRTQRSTRRHQNRQATRRTDRAARGGGRSLASGAESNS